MTRPNKRRTPLAAETERAERRRPPTLKLIVTIPAYDEAPNIGEVIAEIPRSIVGVKSIEVLVVDDGSRDGTAEAALAAGADYVVSHGRNLGLAAAFRTALREAVSRGADLIVNTDADNHYDQSRIPDLIQPLLRGEAEIAIGSRMLNGLRMRPANKYGNRIANYLMQRLLSLPDVDVSTGYRAYTREAALRLNVLSEHTYTHETLINALDQRLAIANVPLPARPVERPSRLIRSISSHIWKASMVILRSFTLYRPLQVWGTVGIVLALVGALPFIRFLFFFMQGQSFGHVQSLLAGSALLLLGVQMYIVGLLASAIGWNRRLLEDVLYRLKDQDARASAMTNGAEAKNGREPEHVGRDARAA
ncbi:MAG: glycosyltransferase family 2 protein [Dehalococcoidia bacterium]|nr:glycosyltransferase family 2 protein [Dehalococcoidia bacterium]